MATARCSDGPECGICKAVFTSDLDLEACMGCKDCQVLLCKPCAEQYAQHEPSLKCPQCRGQADDQLRNAVCIVKDALNPRVQNKLNALPGIASLAGGCNQTFLTAWLPACDLIRVFAAVDFKINPKLHCYESLLELLEEISKLGVFARAGHKAQRLTTYVPLGHAVDSLRESLGHAVDSLRELSFFMHCSLCKQTGGPIPGGVPSVIAGGAFLCDRHKTAIEVALTQKLERAIRNDQPIFTEAMGSAPKKFSLEPAAYPEKDLSHIAQGTLSVRETRLESGRVQWPCKGHVYVTQDGMRFDVRLVCESDDPVKMWCLNKGTSYRAELSRLLDCAAAEQSRKRHCDNDVQLLQVVKRPCLADDSSDPDGDTLI